MIETPDKIHVVIDPKFGTMAVNYDKNDVNNVDYIRRDTVLELLKKELSTAMEEEPSVIRNGKIFIASRLIDKIEML